MTQDQRSEQRCPLCRGPAEVRNDFLTVRVKCDGCGFYDFDDDLFPSWPGRYEQKLHLLSGYVREQTELRRAAEFESRPDVTSLTVENLPGIIGQLPQSIRDRSTRLLMAISRRTTEFGQTVRLNTVTDCSLGYAVSIEEFYALLSFLAERQLVRTAEKSHTKMVACFEAALTAAGFEEVELLRGVNRDSAQGFVAMSFDDGLRPIFDGPIFNAISAAGYKPMRIDRKDHNNQIVDEMLAEIRRSRFVVADFTSHRNGVYFEAGFAMGLGIPVIWLVRKDHMDDAHFDTKQYNFIDWEPGDDLGERLYNRIRATIGEGPVIQSPAEQAVLIEAMRALTPDGAPTRKD